MNKSEMFWDKTANYYDQEEKKDEQTYIKIIEKTKKYLKISDIVLDFGCGTGRISNEITDNVKVIHAIDISSKMIEIAKRKADGRKIENIDYCLVKCQLATNNRDKLIYSLPPNFRKMKICVFWRKYNGSSGKRFC